MLKGLKNMRTKSKAKQHELPHSKNNKATQNENNIRTTALEQLVSYTTGDLKHFYCWQIFTPGPDIILDTKIYKMFGFHKLPNSVYAIVKTQSLLKQKRVLLLANPTNTASQS